MSEKIVSKSMAKRVKEQKKDEEWELINMLVQNLNWV